MTVRVATEADVDACLDLFEAVVAEGIWLGAEPPVDRDHRRERTLAALADECSVWLVAVAPEGGAGEGERTGEGVAGEQIGEGIGEVAGGGGVGEGGAGERIVGQLNFEVAPYGVASLGMCVAADWRGRGVGGALVEEAAAAARQLGAHKLALQVWPHNHAARRLYLRHGFEEEGRLRRHYPRRNGELWDAVVMGRILDQDRPGSSVPEWEDAGDG